MLNLTLRRENQSAPAVWDPSRTAGIVCDMWDDHWCKSAARRTAELAPHLARFVGALRDRGVFIIHAPSDTMAFYEGTPQRKLAQQAPAVDFPPRPEGWCALPGVTEPPLPVKTPNGGCDCTTQCPHPENGKWPWTRQIATIPIAPTDAVGEGAEVYYLLRQRNLDRAIIMGVHTGMCILHRHFGIKRMTRAGVQMLLVRDLTDAMYSPADPPHVNHFDGTRLIVGHIEKHWCPTITSDQVLGGTPFRFAGDMGAA